MKKRWSWPVKFMEEIGCGNERGAEHDPEHDEDCGPEHAEEQAPCW